MHKKKNQYTVSFYSAHKIYIRNHIFVRVTTTFFSFFQIVFESGQMCITTRMPG